VLNIVRAKIPFSFYAINTNMSLHGGAENTPIMSHCLPLFVRCVKLTREAKTKINNIEYIKGVRKG